MSLDPYADPGTRYVPSRGDRIGIAMFIGAGAVIAAASVIAAVMRIVEVLGSRTVAVLGEFSGTPVLAPIGPSGAAVEVLLDRAVLTTDELPIASLVAIILQQVIVAASIVVGVTCLVLLSISILRGVIFTRRTSRLVLIASIAALVGVAADPFFGNMAANGAFAAISDGDFDNVIMTLDVFPYVLGAFVVAIIGTAFSVGERLQRDTKGLV